MRRRRVTRRIEPAGPILDHRQCLDAAPSVMQAAIERADRVVGRNDLVQQLDDLRRGAVVAGAMVRDELIGARPNVRHLAIDRGRRLGRLGDFQPTRKLASQRFKAVARDTLTGDRASARSTSAFEAVSSRLARIASAVASASAAAGIAASTSARASRIAAAVSGPDRSFFIMFNIDLLHTFENKSRHEMPGAHFVNVFASQSAMFHKRVGDFIDGRPNVRQPNDCAGQVFEPAILRNDDLIGDRRLPSAFSVAAQLDKTVPNALALIATAAREPTCLGDPMAQEPVRHRLDFGDAPALSRRAGHHDKHMARVGELRFRAHVRLAVDRHRRHCAAESDLHDAVSAFMNCDPSITDQLHGRERQRRAAVRELCRRAHGHSVDLWRWRDPLAAARMKSEKVGHERAPSRAERIFSVTSRAIRSIAECVRVASASAIPIAAGNSRTRLIRVSTNHFK